MAKELEKSFDPVKAFEIAGPPAQVDPALANEFAPEEGELDYMKADDLIVLPMMRLLGTNAGPVIEGRAAAGNYWDQEQEIQYEAPVYVVPLFQFMTRCRWGPIGEGDGRPLCRSSNMIEGVGEPGGMCEDCPERKRWTGGTAPTGTCDEVYTFILYLPQYKTELLFPMSRTKGLIGRQIVRLIKSSRQACYTCLFKLGSRVEKSAGGIPYHNITLDTFPNGSKRQLLTAAPEAKALLEELREESRRIRELHKQGKLVPTYQQEDREEDASFDTSKMDAPAEKLGDGVDEF